jgi:hypothetical protein
MSLKPNKAKDPSERKDIAEKICTMIEAAQDMKGNIGDRWTNLEERYRGEPDGQGLQVHDDSEPLAVNIIAPRVDALVTKVCQPLTSQKPYFSASGYASDRNRILENENVVQFCFERARYHSVVRRATRMTCMAAPAIFRVRFLNDPELRFTGPTLELIHPNDFCIYPLIQGDVEKAKLVGHRDFVRVQEIKEKQSSGEYWDTETVYGGDDPQSWESGRSSDWSLTSEASGIVEPDDEQVERWQVIVKMDLDGDGKEERYHAVVALTSRVLLDLQFYGAEVEIEEPTGEIGQDEAGMPVPVMEVRTELQPFSRVWYFPHFVKEPAHGEFFQANPPVQDLIPCQATYSDGMTLLVEGGKSQAFPCGFVEGPTQLTKEAIRYKPGEYHYLPTGAKITFVEPGFNPSVWPALLEMAKADADALLRISQNGTGQTMGKSATEAGILQTNQEEGADEYRDNAAQSGEQIADFMRELCFLHYDQMKEAHGDGFPCNDPQTLAEPLQWEGTGKTSSTLPQVVAQNFQEILQLIQIPGMVQATGMDLPALVKAYVKTKKLPIPDEDLFPEPQGMGAPNASLGNQDPAMAQPAGNDPAVQLIEQAVLASQMQPAGDQPF